MANPILDFFRDLTNKPTGMVIPQYTQDPNLDPNGFHMPAISNPTLGLGGPVPNQGADMARFWLRQNATPQRRIGNGAQGTYNGVHFYLPRMRTDVGPALRPLPADIHLQDVPNGAIPLLTGNVY